MSKSYASRLPLPGRASKTALHRMVQGALSARAGCFLPGRLYPCSRSLSFELLVFIVISFNHAPKRY